MVGCGCAGLRGFRRSAAPKSGPTERTPWPGFLCPLLRRWPCPRGGLERERLGVERGLRFPLDLRGRALAAWLPVLVSALPGRASGRGAVWRAAAPRRVSVSGREVVAILVWDLWRCLPWCERARPDARCAWLGWLAMGRRICIGWVAIPWPPGPRVHRGHMP